MVVLSGGKKEHRIIIPRRLGDLEGRDFDFEKWGFTAKSITTQMAIDNQLSDTIGVFVTQAKMPGPAFDGDLRRGDIITKVSNRPVENLDQLKQVYETLAAEKKILLVIHRHEDLRFVLLKLDGEEKEGTNE